MLPNGLGFGGQMDYFGMWIDSQFERGTFACEPTSTTFGNPKLSQKSTFDIDKGNFNI
jgi:hypothetical protein